MQRTHSPFENCWSCGAQVLWIKTKAGKNMPCNPRLVGYVKGGSERIVTRNGEVISGTTVLRDGEEPDGYGFVAGLTEAYEEQERRKEADESGWGLVLVIPKEVQDASKHLGKADFHARTEGELVGRSLLEGYEDGKKFDPGKVLKETEAEQTLALG